MADIDFNKFAAYWASKGLKMSVRRYRQIADEDKVPKVVKGKILDPMASMVSIAVYYQKLAEGNGSLSLTDERTRLTKINADKKQFELEKARGDVIDRALAMKLWSMVMQNIINKIEIIPAKLPPLAHGLTIPEIKAVVEKMVYEVRNEIANPDLEEIARLGGHHRIVQHGKGKPNSKRVGVGRQKQDVKPGGKRGAGEVVHGEGGVSKADDGCV